ncbi:hypothetical protein RUM44_006034 [Polyplax serrata]|uniref:Serine/threonine-protein kinase ULK3 n=1 Tax=Polyplax serrata TaxID=468196 RepID=A0ABR1AYS9_POLSC
MSGSIKRKTGAIPSIEGYTILESLGSGSYSTVYKAISKTANKDIVAIKCIAKDKLKGSAADNVITEIKLLKLLRHDYIVEMKNFCWDDNYIYIILEYCDGRDLSWFIKKSRKLSEQTCKKFLQQLALAMKYLRDNNICHLDLKPQNLLLSTKPNLSLKLADFGFSQFLSLEERQSSLRGSPLYMAPEMLLLQDYDASVDLWSIGVIMYECLFGRAPYSSKNVQELLDKIKMQKPIEIPEQSGISSECRDLLSRLLQHNPTQRISYNDFFAHSFLDLEHMPSPESYNKAVQMVCDAVKFDMQKKYVDAFYLYCEALRYFVPLIIAETNPKRKNALRAKVNEYITRAENLKQFVCLNSKTSQGVKNGVNDFNHITQGAIFRELNLLCAEDAQLGEVLEMGCNAEEHYAEGEYRLAFDKFQTCIRTLLSVLSKEPPGRRKDLLNNQVKHWMTEAETTKALLSELDLNGANSAVLEKSGLLFLKLFAVPFSFLVGQNKEGNRSWLQYFGANQRLVLYDWMLVPRLKVTHEQGKEKWRALSEKSI